jgi:hypothetical protein
MSTIIQLRLRERATGLHISDAAGGVEDMKGDTGATPDLELPTVVDGCTGPARRFTTDKGATADDIGSAALQEKDLSIQTLIKYDVSGQDTIGTAGIVIACDSAWQLQLDVLSVALGIGSMRLGWAAVSQPDPDIAGAAAQAFAVVDDGYLLLTVTRHWYSASSVRVRYYVNDWLAGEVTSTYGDIDGNAADPVTVGCRPNGADYEYFLAADVDGILVADHEMSIEEIRQTYRRIAVHQPEGRLLVRPMLPPGTAYSIDPDSGIQAELIVEGDGLGAFYSKNQELREDYAPDRAWSMLEDWERVCRLPPGPLDTTETRRNRIVSYLRTCHGYAEPDIKTALADVLDIASDDLEILNYTNRYVDAFATALADYWLEVSPAGGVSSVAGMAHFITNSGADARWESRDDTNGPTYLVMPIDGDLRDGDPSEGCDTQVKVVSTLASNFDNGNYIGLFAYNLAGDLLFFGWRKSGGTVERGYRVYTAAGGWQAWNQEAVVSPPGYIRMRFDGSDDWTLFYHATDPDDDSASSSITGIDLPLNVGIMNMTDVASNPSATQVDVDEWRAFMPNGLRVFNWYAYADPALSGSPDFDGARAIIEGIKPADSQAGATATIYVEADDTDAGADEAPCS